MMDPSQPLMQETWSDVVGTIATSFGTAGVYSDEVADAHSEACYDRSNGTNASSWTAGAQALLSEMARKMGPGKVLMSESNNEVMMGDLHAFLAIVRAAPLFCLPEREMLGTSLVGLVHVRFGISLKSQHKDVVCTVRLAWVPGRAA